MKTTWYDLVSKIAQLILDATTIPPPLATQIANNIGIVEHYGGPDDKKLSGAEKKHKVIDAVVLLDYPGVDKRLLAAVIDAAVDAANSIFAHVEKAEKAINEPKEPVLKPNIVGQPPQYPYRAPAKEAEVFPKPVTSAVKHAGPAPSPDKPLPATFAADKDVMGDKPGVTHSSLIDPKDCPPKK